MPSSSFPGQPDERLADRRAARSLTKAAAGTDSTAFLAALEAVNQTTDGWRLALLGISRLETVSPQIREAFFSSWTEHGGFNLRVGRRPIMLKALRRLMPCDYAGAPVAVYRGASAYERQRGAYGFSWTTNWQIAQRFAEQARQLPEGAVLLRADAPAVAVLARRGQEVGYDEAEVIVDPYRLVRVRVLKQMPHGTLWGEHHPCSL